MCLKPAVSMMETATAVTLGHVTRPCPAVHFGHLKWNVHLALMFVSKCNEAVGTSNVSMYLVLGREESICAGSWQPRLITTATVLLKKYESAFTL